MIVPRAPIDLSTLHGHNRLHGEAATFVESLAMIHEKTTSNLEASATKYKAAADSRRRRLVFDEDDLM